MRQRKDGEGRTVAAERKLMQVDSAVNLRKG